MTDLIIFGGQSNMQGQSERLAGEVPFEGALEYRFLTDSLIPLKNPCGEDVRYDGTEGFPFGTPDRGNWHSQNAIGSTVYGHTSLVPFFCKAYRETAKDHPEVVAVHAAKGATQIDYWLGDGYDMFVRKSKAAMAKTAETDRIGKKYVVWLQGESDAIASVKKDDYKKLLSEFAHRIKEELDIDRFAIIRVGLFKMDDTDWEIIRAQEELCAEDDLFVMLTRVCSDYCSKPEYKEYMSPEVFGHYSALGLTKLGEIAGAALAEVE